MMTLIRCLVAFFLAFFLVVGETTMLAIPVFALQSGDYTYEVTKGEVTITAYTGAGGAVNIPEKISAYPVKVIGIDAFSSKNTITSVTIPSSVTNIAGGAFYNCTSLKSVVLPKNLKTITVNLFAGCTVLADVNIPVTVTSIERNAFMDCNSLKKVTLPSKLKTMGTNAFSDCDVITSISVPNSVTFIGSSAFYGCDQLSVAKLSTNLTSIEYDLFGLCSKLKKIIIPSKVTYIYNSSFQSCASLDTVTIPSSVGSIGEGAFIKCDLLKTAYFLGDAPTMGDNVFAGDAVGFRIFYAKGKTGYTNPWHSYATTKMPETPTVNVVLNTSKIVSGKAEKGGEVTLSIGQKTYSVTASSGAWKKTFSAAFPAGTAIKAKVLLNGGYSIEKTIYVKPAIPSVNIIKQLDTRVTGKATKSAVVFVKIGNKLYSAKASSTNGAFSAKIPAVNKGSKVSVYCKAGGQTSASKNITAI